MGAQGYLDAGASWGSHAAIVNGVGKGEKVTLSISQGKYTIATTHYHNDTHWFSDNGYMDSGQTNWTFEAVPGLTNTYKLKTDAGYYAFAAAGMYNVTIGSDPGTNKAYWKLVTATSRDDVSGASATNPIDLTHKITNPRFDDDNSGWQDAPARGGNTSGTNGNEASYDDRNPCAEHYNKTYDTYQELTGLSNGVYAISVQGFYREGGYEAAASKHVAGTESLNAILYANTAEQPFMSIFEEAGKVSHADNVTTGGINGAFPNTMTAASSFFSAGLYWNKVYVVVTDGTLKFGVKKSTAVGADWTIFDNFRLEYFGDCTIEQAKFGPSVSALASKVLEAQAYINSNPALSSTQIAALQTIVNENDNDNNAFTTTEQYDTAIDNIETALVAYKAMVAPYAAFNALKTKANAIAAVEYKETTSGSHTTFTGNITTQTSAADNAITADDINAAIAALKAAIKTYIDGAEPKNEGEFFDITCLMVNPNFDDSHNGWTYLSAPGVSWSNCEYYMQEFDIYQIVTGLPTGSYSLSVQAFQRPGWAGNVYDAYPATDNASSVLYINSITSKVKNIAADAQSEYKLGDGTNFGYPNDSRVGTEGNYKYLPNSQQGAKLYFDAGLYDATCAAVVTTEDGGNLRLGFKSTKAPVDGDWTIFDNFRLYYYGSSLLVYYQQYWPQLVGEVEKDLANGAYANVLVSSEDEALDAALAANPSTADEYEEAITTLVNAQTAFQNAAPSYDAMVDAKSYASLTEITANIGTGLFQYPTSTTTKWSTYISAKSAVDNYSFTTGSTAADAQALVDDLDAAIVVYRGITLNAPDPDSRYWVTIHDEGQAWDGNAITFIEGGRTGEGDYAIKYLAASNKNLNQALKFTAVEGNKYKISGISVADGTELYLTGKLKGYEDGNNDQIRTIDDASKALEITVSATTTDNQFKLINETGTEIARNSSDPDNGVFAAGDVGSYFTIAEATQATVDVNIPANQQYATRIFPFTPTWPDEGVTAYSCTVEGNTLNLTKVTAPVANVPYIIEADDADEGYSGAALSGWGTATGTSYTVQALTGVYEEILAPESSYVLANIGGKVAFYQVEDEEDNRPNVGAYRCYLTAPAATEARALYFPESEATAIDAISALTSGEAQIFNAAGAQLPSLQKGMNILKLSNGKSIKVMVK